MLLTDVHNSDNDLASGTQMLTVYGIIEIDIRRILHMER
jgi:hypothetical protein